MRKITERKQNHKPNQPNRGKANYHRVNTEATIIEGDTEQTREETNKKECRNCIGSYPHQGKCPAKEKGCNSSGKDDRFRRVRRSKSLKKIQMQEPANIEISSSEDEFTFHIYKPKVSNIKQPNTKVKICDTEVKMLVDTGTTINSLDESSYSKL